MGEEHGHKLRGRKQGKNDSEIGLCATGMKEGFDKNFKLPSGKSGVEF